MKSEAEVLVGAVRNTTLRSVILMIGVALSLWAAAGTARAEGSFDLAKLEPGNITVPANDDSALFDIAKSTTSTVSMRFPKIPDNISLEFSNDAINNPYAGQPVDFTKRYQITNRLQFKVKATNGIKHELGITPSWDSEGYSIALEAKEIAPLEPVSQEEVSNELKESAEGGVTSKPEQESGIGFGWKLFLVLLVAIPVWLLVRLFRSQKNAQSGNEPQGRREPKIQSNQAPPRRARSQAVDEKKYPGYNPKTAEQLKDEERQRHQEQVRRAAAGRVTETPNETSGGVKTSGSLNDGAVSERQRDDAVYQTPARPEPKSTVGPETDTQQATETRQFGRRVNNLEIQVDTLRARFEENFEALLAKMDKLYDTFNLEAARHREEEEGLKRHAETERMPQADDILVRRLEPVIETDIVIHETETAINDGLRNVKADPGLREFFARASQSNRALRGELDRLLGFLGSNQGVVGLKNDVAETLSRLEKLAAFAEESEPRINISFNASERDEYLVKGISDGLDMTVEMFNDPEKFFREELDRLVKRQVLPLLDVCFNSKPAPRDVQTIERVAAAFGLEDISPRPGEMLDSVNHELLQFEPGPQDQILEVSIRGYVYDGEVLRKPVVIAGRG